MRASLALNGLRRCKPTKHLAGYKDLTSLQDLVTFGGWELDKALNNNDGERLSTTLGSQKAYIQKNLSYINRWVKKSVENCGKMLRVEGKGCL